MNNQLITTRVLRKIAYIVLILIVTFSFSGCIYDIWYENYPISYGEGIVWVCENDDLGFYGHFVTAQVQYGHYGKGEFTYNDSTVQFQLMFTQNTVSLVYYDVYEYISYFAGDADFRETCMSITINQVEDDRFSSLLGSKLSFYKTDYHLDDILQYEWSCETEEFTSSFSIEENAEEGWGIWGDMNYNGIDKTLCGKIMYKENDQWKGVPLIPKRIQVIQMEKKEENSLK